MFPYRYRSNCCSNGMDKNKFECIVVIYINLIMKNSGKEPIYICTENDDN